VTKAWEERLGAAALAAHNNGSAVVHRITVESPTIAEGEPAPTNADEGVGPAPPPPFDEKAVRRQRGREGEEVGPQSCR
jgi:hypothetical protein